MPAKKKVTNFPMLGNVPKATDRLGQLLDYTKVSYAYKRSIMALFRSEILQEANKAAINELNHVSTQGTCYYTDGGEAISINERIKTLEGGI